MADFTLANNSSTAREMFRLRLVYDAYILAELQNVSGINQETIQIKDFKKDERLLIGRVDGLGNPILLNKDFLTPLQQGGVGGSLSKAINFVSDSFKLMQQKYRRDLRIGNIRSDSEALGDLQAVKGFTDPTENYYNYLDYKKGDIKRYILRRHKLNHIRDFDSFVEIFMEYVRASARREPITETMYLLTKENSVLSSGLAIEIYDGDYGDDEVKYDLFYKDRNFEYLKNLAYGYGFMIDKNIPWRLVADMNSPQMKPYIENRLFVGAEAGAVLGTYFTRVHTPDLERLSQLMIDTYNMIARARSRTKITKSTATTNGSGKTIFRQCRKKEIIRRRQESYEKILEYPISYWIDKYVEIRNYETSMLYNDGAMRTIIKNATDLANSLDTATAMRYIASKFDNVEHFEGSLFHDLTRIRMGEDPNASGKSVDETVKRSVQASNFVIY